MNYRKPGVLIATIMSLAAVVARGEHSNALSEIIAKTNILCGNAPTPTKPVATVSIEDSCEIEIAAEVAALQAVSSIAIRTRDPFGLKMRGNFKIPDVEFLPKETKKKAPPAEITFEDAVANIPLGGLNATERVALVGHRTLFEGDLLAWQWHGKAFQGWVSHIGASGLVVRERGSDKTCVRKLNADIDPPEWRASEPDYASLPGAEPVPPDHSVKNPVVPPPLPAPIPAAATDSINASFQSTATP
jgi:hypothetical protein